MDIIVCVKHVPETAEADIKIDASGKAIEKSGLVFDINEWDDYALEEAVRLKEKFGGTVAAITLGSEEADATLRKCLARGADTAIRLWDAKFEGSDGYATARILSKVVKGLPFDLILTGAQAGDDGYAVVGTMLAELLGIPHATMVKKIELDGEAAKLHRELEGGFEELLELKLPAVFAVSTGINEPVMCLLWALEKPCRKR